ncbi:MAG: preprotein translocase subunit YajC [Deltaproteobacteria bacterium]|nr:preprotein translocase subunit YajC [Deltaproteobacteria bacterium]
MAPQGGQGAQGGGMSILFMIVPLFLIFYFLLFRPQKKRADEQKALLASLKKGDMVMTQGGLHGRITGLTDSTLTLEIAEKVRVKVSRGHIAGKIRSEAKS